MTAGPVLEARGVTKRFDGITALDGVGLDVRAGECVGLVGPNGAGKTTLFDCLTGRLAPDGGEVRFLGHDLARASGVHRARLGMARTFQRVELFAGLTVRDHLVVAAQARASRRGGASHQGGPSGQGGAGRRVSDRGAAWRGVLGGGAWRDVWRDVLGRGGPTAEDRDRVAAVAGLVGLGPDLDRPVEALTLGRARLVELGRALACEPVLLFLDEPSSGLDRPETEAMAAVIEQVRDRSGVAVLLIEHDVPLVRRLAARVHVLDAGRLVAAGATGAVLADPAVRRAYLGTPGSAP